MDDLILQLTSHVAPSYQAQLDADDDIEPPFQNIKIALLVCSQNKKSKVTSTPYKNLRF